MVEACGLLEHQTVDLEDIPRVNFLVLTYKVVHIVVEDRTTCLTTLMVSQVTSTARGKKLEPDVNPGVWDFAVKSRFLDLNFVVTVGSQILLDFT